LSSEVEFFDFLYLGIFIILSPAFDNRFYLNKNPPANVVAEVGHSRRHFYHLFHVFSDRFIIDLDGEVVALSYVVDRMLAEFAAAAVNFSRAIQEDKGDDEDEDKDGNPASMFIARIQGLLKESNSDIFPYYSSCLVRHHKHFTWTGPKLRIYPLSPEVLATVPLVTPLGESSDLLSCQIYTRNADPERPSSPDVPLVIRKQRDQDTPSPSKEMTRKRKRLL